MKNLLKRMFHVIFVLSLLILLTLTVSAAEGAEVLDSGSSRCAFLNNANENGTYTWTLYSDGELVFESTDTDEMRPFSNRILSLATKYPDEDIYTISSLKTRTLPDSTVTFNDFVTKITLKNFTHFGDMYGTPLCDWKNLTAIDFGSVTVLGLHNNSRGLRGNSKLVTVGSTAADCYEDGVVNLSFFTSYIQRNNTSPLFGHSTAVNSFFSGDTAIKKIILPGFDYSASQYATADEFANAFNGLTSLEEVVIPSSFNPVTISSTAFVGCTNLKRIVFQSENDVAFSDIFSLPENVTDIVCYTNAVKDKLISAGIDRSNITVATPEKYLVTGQGESVRESYKTWFNYSFNTLDSELTLTVDRSATSSSKTWGDDAVETSHHVLSNSSLSQGFKDFKTAYGSQVKSIKLVGFVELVGWYGASPLGGWSAVETIDLGTITTWQKAGSGNGFKGNSKLVTMGSSHYGTLRDGTVDISTVTGYRSTSLITNFNDMFSGCSSMKKVVLPSLKDGSYSIDTDDTSASVTTTQKITLTGNRFYTDMFKGCTALEEIVLPSAWTNISCLVLEDTDGDKKSIIVNEASSPLAACTALKKITLKSESAVTLNENIIPDKAEFTICCSSSAAYESLKPLFSETKVIMTGIISSNGFSLRLKDYNGLRTLYSFNNDMLPYFTAGGLEFKEYGAILISKNKLSSNTLELVKSGDEYVPSIDAAVKQTIASGIEEGMPKITGKLLNEDIDGNTGTSDFAVTIVNFKNNYTSDVYSVGYAIFEDSNGNEYIEYANYGDINSNFKFISIYDLAVGMYTNNPASSGYDSLLSSDTDEAAVWKVLYNGGVTELTAGLRELVIDGEVTMMVASDKNGKNNLFVRLISGGKPTSAQIARAEAKAAELGVTFDKSVGFKVSDDGVFEGAVYSANEKVGYTGTLTIYDAEEVNTKYQVFWGDKNGRLADYDGFAPVASTGKETVFTFPSHTIIPAEADRLLVYPVTDSAGNLSNEAMAALLPSGRINLGELRYEFQAVSDIHISAGATNDGTAGFRRFLTDVKANSPSSLGIFVNGDIFDRSLIEEYNMFDSVINEFGTDNLPTIYLGIGNHDVSYGEDGLAETDDEKFAILSDRFITYRNGRAGLDAANDKPYFDVEFENAHFVFLGPEKFNAISHSETQKNWLEAIIIADKAVGKTTYIFNHFGIKGTVAGTLDVPGQGAGIAYNSYLPTLLRNYPDVVLFSSHTHWEMIGEKNMVCGGDEDNEYCTIFNTASLSYTRTFTYDEEGNPSGAVNVSGGGGEAYYIYAYENGFIVKGKDFNTGKWIPEAQYVVKFKDAVTKKAIYTPDEKTGYTGTLTLLDTEQTETSYQIFWGDKNGRLDSYRGFAPIASEGYETVFTFPENTIIPEEADRLLVFTLDAEGNLSNEAFGALLPEGRVDLGEIKYEFQSVSDIHVTRGENWDRTGGLKKMINDINVISPNSIGIFVNGDFVDRSTPLEYEKVSNVIAEYGENIPTMYFGIGNHEANYGEDWVEDNTKHTDFSILGPRYVEFRNSIATNITTDKTYFDVAIDGIHFVFLGTETYGITFSEEQLAWLEAILEADKADGKPTYVFCHWGINDTVAGTLPDKAGQNQGFARDTALAQLLKNYPEVVLFSGHTHWEMIGEKNMISYSDADNSFGPTVFNTAAIAYTYTFKYDENGVAIGGQSVAGGGSEGYYFYGYEGGFIARGRDFLTGKWIPEAQYVVTYDKLS